MTLNSRTIHKCQESNWGFAVWRSAAYINVSKTIHQTFLCKWEIMRDLKHNTKSLTFRLCVIAEPYKTTCGCLINANHVIISISSDDIICQVMYVTYDFIRITNGMLQSPGDIDWFGIWLQVIIRILAVWECVSCWEVCWAAQSIPTLWYEVFRKWK